MRKKEGIDMNFEKLLEALSADQRKELDILHALRIVKRVGTTIYYSMLDENETKFFKEMEDKALVYSETTGMWFWKKQRIYAGVVDYYGDTVKEVDIVTSDLVKTNAEIPDKKRYGDKVTNKKQLKADLLKYFGSVEEVILYLCKRMIISGDFLDEGFLCFSRGTKAFQKGCSKIVTRKVVDEYDECGIDIFDNIDHLVDFTFDFLLVFLYEEDKFDLLYECDEPVDDLTEEYDEVHEMIEPEQVPAEETGPTQQEEPGLDVQVFDGLGNEVEIPEPELTRFMQTEPEPTQYTEPEPEPDRTSYSSGFENDSSSSYDSGSSYDSSSSYDSGGSDFGSDD